jgi:hypothetical protein
MFQVSFADKSSDFFKGLPQVDQIKLLEELGRLTPELLEQAQEPLAEFKAYGKTYYRYRFDPWRLYFTLEGENIRCELILSKNTWQDFKVRTGMQSADDREVECRDDFLDEINKHK